VGDAQHEITYHRSILVLLIVDAYQWC